MSAARRLAALSAHTQTSAAPVESPALTASLVAGSSSAMRFEGKYALVTGASKGIGAAIAIRLAEEGAQPATASESSARPSAAVAPAAEDDLEAAAVPGPAPAPGNAKKPSFMRRMSSAFGGSKPG